MTIRSDWRRITDCAYAGKVTGNPLERSGVVAVSSAFRGPARALHSLLLGFLLAACGDDAKLNERTSPRPDGGMPGEDGEVLPDDGGGTGWPTLILEAPENGLVTEAASITVRGRVTRARSVLVNGSEVPVADDRFTVEVPLVEGENPIIVHVAGGPTDARTVVRDSQAPLISLSGPRRGQFLDAAAGPPTLDVAGQVTDAGIGVWHVTLDGTPLQLDAQGRFAARIQPPSGRIHTLVVEATDFVGHVSRATRSALAGRFAHPSAPVPQAISGSVQAAAIDALEPFLARMIMEQGLDEMIASQGSGDFEIHDVSYSRLEIDLTPVDGALRAVIRVYDLVVDFETEQEILFVDVTFEGEAKASRVDLTTRLVFTVTPEGSLGLRMEDPSVSLHDFRVDIRNFPGFLENLLRGTIEDMAVGALEDALRGQVIPELFDPSMLHREVDLLGRTILFNAAIRDLAIDPSGIRLELEASAEGAPDPRVPPAPGALSDPEPLPALPPAQAHLQLLLADDLANRVLHGVWRSGLLHSTLDELLAAQGGEGGGLPIQLNVGLLNSFCGNAFKGVLDDALPVGLRLAGLLPPVAHPLDDPERPLGLQLGDLLLGFEAQQPDGSVVPLLTAAVAADCAIGLRQQPDGKLKPEIRAVTVADLVEEPLVDLNDEAVEAFLGQLVAMMLPLATAQGIDADLGLYPGLTLTDLVLAALLPGHFLVTGNVVPAP